MNKPWRLGLLIAAMLVANLAGAQDTAKAGPRQMENLDRGLAAVRQADGSVFLSWRRLGTDPAAMTYNVYRHGAGDAPVKLSGAPGEGASNVIDTAPGEAEGVTYTVEPVFNGKPLESSKPAAIWEKGYLEIPISVPEGGTIITKTGEPSDERDATYRYRAGDMSVGDLDGDGDYDLVLQWDPSNAKDNSFAGYTGPTMLEGITLEGKSLWRINLGKNIRAGEHYTEFMVYDLDGDGRAEVACKTADGTVDGQGKVIGDAEADWRTHNPGNSRHGRILDGPEFLTVFDGTTGAALATVDYVPGRGNLNDWGGIGGNGGVDNYGNRCDRFLACVAYLDGVHPSLVMCRGVYGRIVQAAWDWDGTQLTQRWVFDSGISHPPFEDASPFSGMGGHSISVGDVDNDGKDEIVYQAMTVDDDGTGLYSTMRRHGDAMFLGDLYPDRPGLETFLITENEDETVKFQTPGAGAHDARTGEPIWSMMPGVDVGRGVAADIDPRTRGAECWISNREVGLIGPDGQDLGPAPRSTGMMVWWDGDALREFVAGGGVQKWNWEEGREEPLWEPAREDGGEAQAQGQGGGPGRRFRGLRTNLIADILGDWREELITTAPSGEALRIYTTTIPTEINLPTLMHDPQYRLGTAWQNVVYNKPALPGYYLGDGMEMPEPPNIVLVGKQ